jgi:ATP-dependent Clp protease protease subunit
MIAMHTGKKVEQVKLDTERDKFLSAKEALAYGLIDRIVSKSKPAAK